MRERRLALGGAFLLFFVCCSLPWVGLWDPYGIGDTGLYRLYGQWMADGRVPYHEFFTEYPPGALVSLLLPALPGAHYVVWFKIEQFACGIGALALLWVILIRLGATRWRLYTPLAIAAAAPALLGPIALNAFDYWATLLTTAAVAALVTDRHKTAFALLGAATAAKIFPAGMLPLALLFLLRRGGRESLRGALAAYVATVVAFFLPFAIVGFGGLGFSLKTQVQRGLQLESLGASVLAAAHHVGLYHSSYTPNLPYAQFAGTLATAVATFSTLIMAAAILLVAWLYHRTDGEADDLAYAAAATLVGIVAFAKVLSPQYLVWLVPLVAATWLRTRSAPLLLLVALGLTQIWVPDRFNDLQALTWVTWVLLVRNLVLVALYGLLVRDLWERAAAAGRATLRTAPAP